MKDTFVERHKRVLKISLYERIDRIKAPIFWTKSKVHVRNVTKMHLAGKIGSKRCLLFNKNNNRDCVGLQIFGDWNDKYLNMSNIF